MYSHAQQSVSLASPAIKPCAPIALLWLWHIVKAIPSTKRQEPLTPVPSFNAHNTQTQKKSQAHTSERSLKHIAHGAHARLLAIHNTPLLLNTGGGSGGRGGTHTHLFSVRAQTQLPSTGPGVSEGRRGDCQIIFPNFPPTPDPELNRERAGDATLAARGSNEERNDANDDILIHTPNSKCVSTQHTHTNIHKNAPDIMPEFIQAQSGWIELWWLERFWRDCAAASFRTHTKAKRTKPDSAPHPSESCA